MAPTSLASNFPAFFLDSRSLLELPTDLWAHAPILFGLNGEGDPVKRLVGVCKWFLSAWHIRPKCGWPYEPVPGEVFRATWWHVEGSSSNFISEFVSENPKTTVTLVQNKKEKLRLQLVMLPSMELGWNSASLKLGGEGRLELLEHPDEVYVFTLPSLSMKGLFAGDLHMEVVGQCQISCARTNLEADVEFLHSRPFCNSAVNRVRGSIRRRQEGEESMYEIEGEFSSQISITRSRDRASHLLFDVEKEPIARKVIKPIREQEPYESGRIWQTVTQALKRHDYGTASVERFRVECSNLNSTPLFQLQDDGQWKYVGEDLEMIPSLDPQSSFERDDDDIELDESSVDDSRT